MEKKSERAKIGKEEQKQETGFSRPTCSTSASQSTDFDSAEERMNLDRPNIVSDDIAKIWPPNSRFTCPKKAVLLTSSFQAVLLFLLTQAEKRIFSQ